MLSVLIVRDTSVKIIINLTSVFNRLKDHLTVNCIFIKIEELLYIEIVEVFSEKLSTKSSIKKHRRLL